MIRTAIVLSLILAAASYAGETIIIPETASTLFSAQALTASTKVTSTSAYTLERTRDVTLEYKMDAAPQGGEATVVFTPLYIITSGGNGAGYALQLTPTDSQTLTWPNGATGLLKFTPPPGMYSMYLMAESTFACTLNVTARGK